MEGDGGREEDRRYRNVRASEQLAEQRRLQHHRKSSPDRLHLPERLNGVLPHQPVEPEGQEANQRKVLAGNRVRRCGDGRAHPDHGCSDRWRRAAGRLRRNADKVRAGAEHAGGQERHPCPEGSDESNRRQEEERRDGAVDEPRHADHRQERGNPECRQRHEEGSEAGRAGAGDAPGQSDGRREQTAEREEDDAPADAGTARTRRQHSAQCSAADGRGDGQADGEVSAVAVRDGLRP